MAQKRRGGGVPRSRSMDSGVRQKRGRDVRARELILQGQDLLARSYISAAQRKFRQALGVCESSIGARSHLALTHLLQGECEQAESETKAVLAVAPDNVLALTILAQALAAQRRWPEAHTTMVRALRCFYAAFRVGEADYDDFVNAARMLATMGDDQRLYQLYRRCVRGNPGAWDETVLTHMGVAAFNLERYLEARWLWRMAQSEECELNDVLDAFLFTVARVEEQRVPPFALDHRLDPDTIVTGESDPPGFIKAMALRTLWHGEDAHSQEAALDLLAQMDDPWVSGLLFSVVRQPDLPDELKMKAGVWLVERGFLGDDEPLEMHVEGRLQEVIIEQESGGSAYSPAVTDLLQQAVDAYERGDEDVAERAYRDVLLVEQDCLPALIGLANICRTTGRGQEAEQFLSRALRIDPHDPMILFNLAILWAQEEKFDKAQTILRELKATALPEQMRSSYYALVGHVALQLDMFDVAEEAFQRCLRADPDNDHLSDDLALIIGKYKRERGHEGRPHADPVDDPCEKPSLEPASDADRNVPRKVSGSPTRKSMGDLALSRQARYEHQPIDPAWPWAKALTGLTQKRLQATARRLQVKNLWKMRKAELSAAIASRLRSRLPWVWQALDEKERAALRWIDEEGGIVTLERLRERFGSDEADNIDWTVEPKTVPMRLQFWGLVFVGRLRGAGHPVAVLLEDTRRLLHDVWRRA